MAYGVVNAARVLGLKVPEDLSVGGFDDLEASAEFVPALTTVGQPMMDLGRIAARYLLEVLNMAEPPGVFAPAVARRDWCPDRQRLRRVGNTHRRRLSPSRQSFPV